LKRFTHLAVGAAVLLLAASVYASAQVPTERPLLEGRGPVAVSIELNGATTPQEVFRTDIELRLRQNGVRVAEKADSNLQLVLQVGAGPTGYRIYDATLQLLEPMARLRDYQASVPKPASESWVPVRSVASWSKAFLGFERSDLLEATVRTRARDLADAFINEYLAANRRK